jgi:hypothetical protein
MVGPPAAGEVVARVSVNYQHLVGQLVNRQQVRSVGVFLAGLCLCGDGVHCCGRRHRVTFLRCTPRRLKRLFTLISSNRLVLREESRFILRRALAL